MVCGKIYFALCLMIISDANPVQFWAVDEDTYNEMAVCSIEPVFWCQRFEADDEITTQVKDSPITRLLITNPDFNGNITGWDGAYALPASSAAETWSYDGVSGGALVVATLNYISTRGLKQSITKRSSNDQYAYRVQGSITCSSYPSNVVLLINEYTAAGVFLHQTQIFSSGVNGSFDVSGSITRPNLGFIALQFVQAGGASAIASASLIVTRADFSGLVYRDLAMDIYDSEDVLINSEDFSQVGTGIFQESFTPTSFGIDSGEITLKIRDKFDDSIIATSDCVDVKGFHCCTTLIQFSNSGPFDDLDFNPASPSLDFFLRVPAIFFEEEFPDEYESIDLSNSEMVQLTSEVRHKKLLDVDFMPFYMIEKLQLVLAHDNVVIDGKNWIKGDGMTKEPGNKRYPLRKTKFLLTDKSFIKRNVL